MELSEVIDREAGLISGTLFSIPNRQFMPAGLFATALKGTSLHMLTESSYNNAIVGSSISFSQEQSLRASVGEFVERYCANFYLPGNCIMGSYETLSATYPLMHPSEIKLFADWQYKQPRERFPFRKLTVTDEIRWIRATDYLNQRPIYVPLFMVYMQSAGNDRFYSPHTSTGLAAGPSLQAAMQGGLFEAAERHAFTYFWYHQQQEPYVRYSAQMMLDAYPNDPQITQLFDNPRVQIVLYDLQAYTPFETILMIMYFTFKGRSYQAMGCATRFSKVEAIKKAALETYQGVEYCLQKEKAVWELNDPEDLDKLDSFEKCAIYYNQYPEQRHKSPLLTDAWLNTTTYAPALLHRPDPLNSLDPAELTRHGIGPMYTLDLTTPDVAEIGYRVCRVITPNFSLLSGSRTWPYLGNPTFEKDASRLFITYPHPFP
ncbi:YcaO-like family protein [Fibrella aestuarina]|nr:YcaO-like family protein [Fibrella aestuarina]